MFQKTRELTEEERKWNLMWDIWAQGKAESPYAELMEYYSEVNNGGHYQYFFNVANCGDLNAEVDKILAILPHHLRDNLKRSYDAFSNQKDIDDIDELFDKCDNVFYENEQILLGILKIYANSLNL